MTKQITNASDLDLLLAVVREQRDKLPKQSRTGGEAIHGLIIEVLNGIIVLAMKKKLEAELDQ